MSAVKLVVVVLVLVSSLGLQLSGAAKRKEIDYDALDRAWEVGDQDVELQSEGDEQFQRLSEKNEGDAKALGPQMVFVTLSELRHNEPLAELATRWKEMLWLGGVEASIYELGDAKILIGLQKGMFINDLRKFLEKQLIVKEYEWNGQTYLTSRQHKRKSSTRKRQQLPKKKSQGSISTRPRSPHYSQAEL